ncbi:MAG: class I SAM-dependent methyltransferase [Dehalococcoidia bacterium]
MSAHEPDGRDRIAHLDRIYNDRHYPLYSDLEVSSHPAGPQSLHELAGSLLTTGSRILDAGCRDATHLIHLVRTNGCQGVGVDPLRWHVERAVTAVAGNGLGGSICIEQGVIERLPHPPASFDLVWCRDVLTLLPDLDTAAAEFARVLSPDGHAVIYVNVATELLEPREAERINGPLGNVAASMNRERIESAFARAGLAIAEVREVGTEWREYEEETTRPVSDELLKLARLRRRRDEIVSKYGQETYDTAEASLHWLPYQLLGKLNPIIYVLRQD